jgi:hypothetical protein
MRTFLRSALLVLLSGCTSVSAPAPLTADAVEKVQMELKRQIGLYMELAAADDAVRASALWDAGRTSDTRQKREQKYSCGIGDISYQVDSATVEMITSIEMNGGISAKTPIFTSANLGSDATNSQDLTYSLKTSSKQPNITPLVTTPQQREILLQGDKDHPAAPIAAVLLAFRDGMIQAALKPKENADDDFKAMACFIDQTDGTSSKSHSIKIGANTVVSGGIAVIALADVSFGPSLTVKGTSNTTITINFSHQSLLTDSEMSSPTKPTRLQPPGLHQTAYQGLPTERHHPLMFASYRPSADNELILPITPSDRPDEKVPVKDCKKLPEAARWLCEEDRDLKLPPADNPLQQSPRKSTIRTSDRPSDPRQ